MWEAQNRKQAGKKKQVVLEYSKNIGAFSCTCDIDESLITKLYRLLQHHKAELEQC